MSTPSISGRCLCGDITLEISGDPVNMAQCHCEDCRRSSGTGHFSNAFFQEADVVISGTATGYSVTTDSGNQNTRYFCPKCGSRLYGLNSGRPGMVTVHVGSLDDSSWFDAKFIAYQSAQQPWDKMDENIPAFAQMPPPPPAK